MKLKPWVDRWTLVHFAFWFVIGANYNWHDVPLWAAAVLTGVGAYLWEVVELVLEKMEWVSGNEDWRNRWISDPAIGFIGAAAGYLWV